MLSPIQKTVIAYAAAIIAVVPILAIGNAFGAMDISITDDETISVNSDYFSVGIYSDEECTVIPSSILANSVEYVTTTGDVRTLTTSSISANPLYFRIDGSSHSWSSENEFFTVSAVFSCYFDETLVSSAQLTLSFGNELSLKANSENADGTVNLESGVYPLSFTISNASVVMAEQPTDININISITVLEGNTGTFIGSCERTLTVGGSVPIVDTDTADISIEAANIENPSIAGGDYVIQDSQQEGTPDDETTVYTIEIKAKDQTGIADGSGHVTLDVIIPTGERFCVRVSGSSATNTTNMFWLTISIDEDSATIGIGDKGKNGGQPWSNTVFNTAKNTFGPKQCYSSTFNSDQYLYRANDKDYWMTGNESVSLHLAGSGGMTIPSDIKLEIVFWPHNG